MRFYFLFCVLCVAQWAFATDIVTLVPPESEADVRKQYSHDLIKLALEKTRPQYGDYRIEYTPSTMNSARSRFEMEKNHYTNLVAPLSFQNEYLDSGLDYVRFPIDLGLTGYRICFVSPEAKKTLASVQTLDDLRHYSIGQATGWPDVDILRFNGFKVVTVPKYESLFLMVAASRFDLFCRGINELEIELKSHSHIARLDYDRNFTIAYPLLRFFFSNQANQRILERLSKGIQIAHQDGSLKLRWQKENESALGFVKLKQRKIFHLNAPDIDRVDFDYRQYFFDPIKGR